MYVCMYVYIYARVCVHLHLDVSLYLYVLCIQMYVIYVYIIYVYLCLSVQFEEAHEGKEAACKNSCHNSCGYERIEIACASKKVDNLKSKIQLGKYLGNQHLPHHHVDGT